LTQKDLAGIKFGVAALQIVRYDDYVRNHHWRRLGWIWQFAAL